MHKNKKILDVWLARKSSVTISSYYPQYYRHVGFKPLLHTVVLVAHKYLNDSLNTGKLHMLSEFQSEVLQKVTLLHGSMHSYIKTGSVHCLRSNYNVVSIQYI